MVFIFIFLTMDHFQNFITWNSILAGISRSNHFGPIVRHLFCIVVSTDFLKYSKSVILIILRFSMRFLFRSLKVREKIKMTANVRDSHGSV